jgi:hypothetical protein
MDWRSLARACLEAFGLGAEHYAHPSLDVNRPSHSLAAAASHTTAARIRTGYSRLWLAAARSQQESLAVSPKLHMMLRPRLLCGQGACAYRVDCSGETETGTDHDGLRQTRRRRRSCSP